MRWHNSWVCLCIYLFFSCESVRRSEDDLQESVLSQCLAEPRDPTLALPLQLSQAGRLAQKAWTQTWHQTGFCLFIFLLYKSCALVGRCTVRQVSGGLYYSVTLGDGAGVLVLGSARCGICLP